MESKDGKVKASIEEIATYNMLLTEAIYAVLADKGIITKEEVMDRVQTLKKETTNAVSKGAVTHGSPSTSSPPA